MTTSLKFTSLKTNSLVLNNISWDKFKQIEATFKDIEAVRFIYLDETLEITMNLSREHEQVKSLIAALLEAYMREKKIRFYMWGSATIGDKTITGQKEPDESYNIHSKKDVPDLVIEVIFTSGDLKILEIYRRIGVSEVWFWKDGLLTVYYLQDNQYIRVSTSKLLSDLNLKVLSEYINYHDQYDAVNEFIDYLKS